MTGVFSYTIKVGAMVKHQHLWHNVSFVVVFAAFIIQPFNSIAQAGDRLSPSVLKKLSVEDLMNIEVTSVSKSPEKLTEVASAIQVLTGEDIQRSASNRLPEALRLASNLQVAQSNSHDWAVTARGFNGAPLSNNTLANKLLVMIDGRSVYTPMFGGVFWDVQNVLLEDVDRVEVVSGPGGTLWGANAVNGVINIISKSARETQGLYVVGATGTLLQDFGGVRYGSHVDSTFFFRVYGQRLDQHGIKKRDETNANDQWNMTQGGFRMDYLPSSHTTLTFQGDFYGGKEDDPTSSEINGQNLLGRWTRAFSDRSDLSLQVYFDRTWRNLPLIDFRDQLNTYDVDFQHHFPIGFRHNLLWGVGYRVMENDVRNSVRLTLTPATRTLHLFNGFIQDQIALVPRRLELTLGTKLLHNDYSDFELQPSARLAWTPTTKHTLWTAISRSVRTPTRFDADAITPTVTTENREFDSEKVVAYEIGYRVRPLEKLSFSLATFYNKYDDLRSINVNVAAPPAFVLGNDQRAETWGVEISGNFFATSWWRLRGGFTYLDKQFSAKSASVYPGSDLFEGIDPQNQVLLQSIMDITKNIQFDIVGRYVDALPASLVTIPVPAYSLLDVQVAWNFRWLTFSVVGQNLGAKTHAEFGSRRIPGSLYVKTALRF